MELVDLGAHPHGLAVDGHHAGAVDQPRVVPGDHVPRPDLARHAMEEGVAGLARLRLVSRGAGDALAHEGFYGLCVPAEFGGRGQPPSVFAAVVETLQSVGRPERGRSRADAATCEPWTTSPSAPSSCSSP